MTTPAPRRPRTGVRGNLRLRAVQLLAFALVLQAAGLALLVGPRFRTDASAQGTVTTIAGDTTVTGPTTTTTSVTTGNAGAAGGAGGAQSQPSDPGVAGADAAPRPDTSWLAVTGRTPFGDRATVGSPFLWELDVTNAGGSAADAVGLTDALPVGWTYVVGSARITPQPDGTTEPVEPTVTTVGAVQTLAWDDLGPLAVDATVRIDLATTPTDAVLPDVAHPQTSTAQAWGDGVGGTDSGDPATSAGPATVAATIPSADLAASRTVTTTPVAPGGTARWTIGVRNAGPDPAPGPFTVVDSVPAGLAFRGASGTGWTCDLQGDGVTVACTLSAPSDLAVGASLPPISVSARVPDGTAAGSSSGTATVHGAAHDPDPTNDSATSAVTVAAPVVAAAAGADLTIVKTHTGTPEFGGTVAFDLAVTNLGDDDANGVHVVDPLPPGLAPTSASGSGWMCTITNQAVACDLAGTLVPGPAPAIQVVASVGAAAVPAVANTATVSSSTIDPDPTNDSSTDVVAVEPSVDLSIQKSHDGDFQVGDIAEWTIAVSNAGPTQDPGPIQVTDTLPAGLVYLGTEGDDWGCGYDGQDVTCLDEGPLEVGAETTITLYVGVLPGALPQVSNTATVASAAPDVDPSNNTDTDVAAVDNGFRLVVAKASAVTHDAKKAMWGILVGNAGPGVADGLTVTDNLPAGLTYTSTISAGWTCGVDGQTVTCTYDSTLLPGQITAPLVILTDVTPTAGRITNTATATAAGAELTGDCPGGAPSCDDASIIIRQIGTAGSGSTPPGSLAFTGSDALPLGLIGLSMLATGALLAWAATRGGLRRPTRPHPTAP